MKKRILAILLVICLCAALLPVVASAEPAQGLYAEIDSDNMPVGEPMTQVNAEFIVDYDDASAKTVYFYKVGVGNCTRSISGKGLTGNLIGNDIYAITVAAGSGTVSGNVSLIDDNGGPNFPITFNDTSIDVGLYYKRLAGATGPEDPDLRLPNDAVYTNAPISMPPYVQRADIAVFFYDGEDYTPVNVTSQEGLAIDLYAAGEIGWYQIMAYDFTAGNLLYYADVDDDGTNEEYSIKIDGTLCPDYAFYSESALEDESSYLEAFRMYALMEEPENSGQGTYQGVEYDYVTTLYMLAADSSFTGFEAQDIKVTCGKQLYNENGYMVNYVDENGVSYEFQPMTRGVDYDYRVSIAQGKHALEFTIYANESDLFFRAEKDTQNWDEWYGGYVNLLAATEDSPLMLNLGNQGSFATASFLPAHLFDQAEAAGVEVSLQKPGFAGTITCNSALTADIHENISLSSSVAVDMETADEETRDSFDEAIDDASGADASVIEIISLHLYYDGESQHDFVDGGEAVIAYDCDVPNGATVRVYYIDEDGNVSDEYFEAVYEDGTLRFPTNHFSMFAIASVKPVYVYTPSPAVKPEVEPPFTDVPAGSYYADAVKWAYNNDVTTGATETTFAPAQDCQRAQVITFLWRAAGCPEPAGTGKAFGDVKGGAYYEKAVKWAVEKGITNGLSADIFGVDAEVTRAQFVTFLWRYAGCPKPAGTKSFDDVSSGAYYSDAVLWAAENGITDGMGGGKFAPNDVCTRAQIVTFLYRYFG